MALCALPVAAEASSTFSTYIIGLAVMSCRQPEDRPLLGRDRGLARGLALAQGVERLLDHRRLGRGFLVAALGALLEVGQALLEAVEVGQHQLGLDDLGVAHRIDAARDVGDVAVLEAAQHVGDGVDLADVGEELVAQAFALRRALDQAGDVDELELGVDDLGRARDAASLSSRGSGTATRPTLGSMVQNG